MLRNVHLQCLGSRYTNLNLHVRKSLVKRFHASSEGRRAASIIAHLTRSQSPWHRQRHLGSFRRQASMQRRAHPYGESSDTIYALSTATGRGAIAIIRISGRSCLEVYQALCPGKALPRPRRALVRTLHDPANTSDVENVLDSASLVLFFEQGHSATGEDLLELHVHGGTAVVSAVLGGISRCPSSQSRLRYAEPGEFTRRAFFNNRLDLTQVEALGDVLSAVTEQQRKLSLRGTGAQLGATYEIWRNQLLDARAELEALIDFSEDQHFEESPVEMLTSISSRISCLCQNIRQHLNNVMRGELLRSGVRVALLGPPNAGKSSLMNQIIGRDAAIVSREAGTTRDVIEIGIDLGGYLCRFADMAGLRNQQDASSNPVVGIVEMEGMRRARAWAIQADIIILVLPLTVDEDGQCRLAIDMEVRNAARECADRGIHIMAVVNKIDLMHHNHGLELTSITKELQQLIPHLQHASIYQTSCIESGHVGLDALKTGLLSAIENLTAVESSHPDSAVNSIQELLGATERHRMLLAQCLRCLQAFTQQSMHNENANGDGPDIVLAAETLRDAADCLARITGRCDAGDVEELLGVVFARFCVGK